MGTQWNLYESTIGKLGWLKVSLGRAAYLLAGLQLLACMALASGKPVMDAEQHRFTLGLAALSVLLVSLPLYLFATREGAAAIFGL